jgi:transposase InsO family protein
MDINYIYIHGARRNPLLLTVIDVYSRKTLGQILQYNIRKDEALMLLSLIIIQYRIIGFIIRNDNGSQFIATIIRLYLKERGITQ